MVDRAPRILLVDDEHAIQTLLSYPLRKDGYDVVQATDGRAALDRFSEGTYDLVVLDLMLPKLDGLEVCRRIRATSRVPIVFLSSRGEELDRVMGLELGGDDYLAKPFSTRELVSRVKAVLRRAAPDEKIEAPVVAGALRIDPIEHRCFAGTVEIALTATEFRLLQALMERPGRVFTRDALMEVAYEGAHHVSERTLDSHVRGVRAKLREAGVDPIETVHGVGYRLEK